MSEQRDLRADLEICNKAYCGPWTHNEYWRVENPETIASGGSICRAFCENNAAFISSARTGWPEAIKRAIKAEEELEKQQQLFEVQTGRNVEIIKRLNERKKEVCEENAALREGNDLQRDSIQQLSAQVAGLREGLEEIQARCELRTMDDDAHYENYYEAKRLLSQPDPGAEIMERMEKLEAVAEAAKELLNLPETSKDMHVVEGMALHDEIMDRITDALAALDAHE